MAMVSMCTYAQSPIETFDQPWVSPGPNLLPAPPGWIVINQYGVSVTWKQTVPGNTEQPPYGDFGHSAYLNKENVAPSDVIPKDVLISPLITPQINSQIIFKSRLTIADDQGSIYKVYAIPQTVDPTQPNFEPDAANLLATYSELEMNPVQTEWAEKVIAIPQNMAGIPMRVALVMQGDNGDRWFVDDFTVTNSCYIPTALNVTEITDTMATLGWTEQATATAWEIKIAAANDNAEPTGVGTPVSVNPFMVSNLTPGYYKFYVRSVCGPQNMSAWSEPYYFSTDIAYNNILHGIVKYDGNGDGLCNDAGSVLANAPVAVSINGVYAYTVYTNQQGEYTIYGIPDGTTGLNLQVASPDVAFPEIPALVQEVIFDEEINELTILHCLAQPFPENNMATHISSNSGARPGFDAKYIVFVSNRGNVLNNDVSVVITFNSDRLDYISSTLPATVAGNTITIAIGTVGTEWNNNWKASVLTFHVKEPPVNIGGEVLNFTVSLSEIEGDVNQANNQGVLNQVIVNSFDPNDITVHEGAEIKEDQADDYLTYTIRFQNTGNGNAINVRLENTLDDLLDWDTFEPITSSHNNAVKREGDQLEFFFAGINLPYESADEPGSHGFVTYRIKPKAAFGLGDIISNQAGIYFDFNPVIMTNTATTKVVATAGLNDNALAIARLYPNPVKDQLFVEVVNGDLQSVTIHDSNGRLCLSANAGIIDTAALTSGIYFIKVTTDAGSANYKIIKN